MGPLRTVVGFGLLGTFTLLTLAGCSGSFAPTSDPARTAIGSIRGSVYGGQQPIGQAHVYLYAAGTGTPGSASASLLQYVAGSTLSDGTNYYATTTSTGSFSISGDYTCTAGTQLYLYAVGGDSGTGTNSAIGMLAALGQCPSMGGTLASTVPTVTINELTTVAAAYALAGFATDATHIASSGSALGATGIANAFAEAGQLVNVASGTLYATTPSSTAYTTITVPDPLINTIANILAACINTNSSTSIPCNTLLENATSGSSLTNDTATAAINIARFPSNNVSVLFKNQPGTGAPYQTPLPTAPANFALGLQFLDNSLTHGYPDGIAIDAAGNAWISNIFAASAGPEGTVTEFSPTGIALTGANGFASTAIYGPYGIAVDNSDNVWVAASGSLTKLSGSGGSIAVAATYPISAGSVAIDPFGNAWAPGNSSVSKVSPTGSVTTYTAGGIYAVAIDTAGDVWIPNYDTNSITELSNFGAVLNASPIPNAALGGPEGIAIDNAGFVWVPGDQDNDFVTFSGSTAAATTYTPSGLSQPTTVAIDGAGNAWITNTSSASVAELSGTSPGTVLSGSGYSTGGIAPYGVAVDGSGNLWVPTENALTEFIGLATPVATPIAYGVKNNLLGSRP